MADINQSVQISYTADISELLKEIEKLPGASKEEAQKLSKEITKGLKETEQAAKKAAATNAKSMKQMSSSAKRAGQEFKRLKRSASEMGRGLSDLAVIFGDTDSPMGEMINKIGIISITGAALLPVFSALQAAIVALGVKAAVATGGITVLTGAAAALIMSMGDAEEAAEKQAKSLENLNKKYNKFRKELEKSIEKNEAFKQSVVETITAIEDHTKSLEEKKIELQFELGQISDKEYRRLITDAQAISAFDQIDENFNRREKALRQLLSNEQRLVADATMNFYNAANRFDPGAGFQKNIDFIKMAAVASMQLGESRKELEKRIAFGTHLEHKPAMLAAAMMLAEQAQEEHKAKAEVAKFDKERTVEQGKQVHLAQQNIDLENDLWWLNRQGNKTQADGLTMADLFLAKQERLLAIQEKISASIENQRKTRLSLLEEDLKRSKSLAEFTEIITKQHQLQVIELLNQKIAKQKIMEQNLAEAQSAEEVAEAHRLNAEILKEIALIDEQRTNLTLSNMAKIAAEEERINQVRLQGIAGLLGNLQTFTSSTTEALKASNDEQLDFQDKLFRMNQAAAIAKIAMDTAAGVAQITATYGPLAPLFTAGLLASAAAQTAVVMSQQPPSASAHMGQPMAPDEQTIRVLSGEAVLDRRTVQSLGGEQGIRSMQQGANRGAEVVVLNTYKHFDKYNKSARRQMGNQRRGSGGY